MLLWCYAYNFLPSLERGPNEQRHHNPYLFHSFFHCKNGNVLGAHMKPFDIHKRLKNLLSY